MLTELGKVLAVETDGLWVETLKESSCISCRAKHGCGQKLLTNVALKSNMTIVKAFLTPESSRIDWRPGDQAILGIEENALVIGTFVAYGIPLLMMVFGATLGSYAGQAPRAEWFSFLGALVGLVSGGLGVRVMGISQRLKSYFQAYVMGRPSGHVGNNIINEIT